MFYVFFVFFFFNDTPTTEIYTLSLHDALPIYICCRGISARTGRRSSRSTSPSSRPGRVNSWPASCVEIGRAHAELQSQSNLVCRLLLEKKKTANRRASQYEGPRSTRRCLSFLR